MAHGRCIDAKGLTFHTSSSQPVGAPRSSTRQDSSQGAFPAPVNRRTRRVGRDEWNPASTERLVCPASTVRRRSKPWEAM